VAINVPIFHDDQTPTPFIEALPESDEIEHPLPDHIYMDCMLLFAGKRDERIDRTWLKEGPMFLKKPPSSLGDVPML
jgi:hypothetical protein